MDPDTYTGIYFYTILIVEVFIFSMIRGIHFFVKCLIASVNLHKRKFNADIEPIR